MRSWRDRRRGPTGRPRVSPSAGCSGKASPNSSIRLRPFTSSDSTLRKRPPMSQPSATSRRNQERSRPGERPQNRLTGTMSASNARSVAAAAHSWRSASGMRRSRRMPKNPARRSRNSTPTAGMPGPEGGARGGGRRSFAADVFEHRHVDETALLEHVDHRSAGRELLAQVVGQDRRPHPERDETAHQWQQQALGRREDAHAGAASDAQRSSDGGVVLGTADGFVHLALAAECQAFDGAGAVLRLDHVVEHRLVGVAPLGAGLFAGLCLVLGSCGVGEPHAARVASASAVSVSLAADRMASPRDCGGSILPDQWYSSIENRKYAK